MFKHRSRIVVSDFIELSPFYPCWQVPWIHWGALNTSVLPFHYYLRNENKVIMNIFSRPCLNALFTFLSCLMIWYWSPRYDNQRLPWCCHFVLEAAWGNQQSGWPSGLRRCVQVAVHFCGRGFESHFWQSFSLRSQMCRKSVIRGFFWDSDSNIFNDPFNPVFIMWFSMFSLINIWLILLMTAWFLLNVLHSRWLYRTEQ